MILRARIGASVAAGILAFGALTACAPEPGTDPSTTPSPSTPSTSTTPSAPSTPTPIESQTPDPGAQPGEGGTDGCTEPILTHLAENGFPDATPQDAATIAIPDAQVATTPACYVTDGAGRGGAVWTTDIQGVLAELGASLTAAGYEQSADYGPYVWWSGGTDPLSAEHSVGAAPQFLADGTEILWASW